MYQVSSHSLHKRCFYSILKYNTIALRPKLGRNLIIWTKFGRKFGLFRALNALKSSHFSHSKCYKNNVYEGNDLKLGTYIP